MTDYRTMFDRDYIGSWDLAGDTVVTITGVVAKKIKNAQEKEEKKPIISIAEFPKKLVANVTNCNVIAGLYGKHVEKWKGKKITLYATTVNAFGSMKDCIRIRPEVPDEAPAKITHEIILNGPDGEQVFTNGGEWMQAFEEVLNATTDSAIAGKLWDANCDAFYKIQTGAVKSENAKAIDVCARIGVLAKQKMGSEQ